MPHLSNLPQNAVVLGDWVYDADAIRDLIRGQHSFPNILPMPQRRRRPAFSKYLYKMRNMVERFSNKLKYFRAVATRYEKDPRNYLDGVQLHQRGFGSDLMSLCPKAIYHAQMKPDCIQFLVDLGTNEEQDAVLTGRLGWLPGRNGP